MSAGGGVRGRGGVCKGRVISCGYRVHVLSDCCVGGAPDAVLLKSELEFPRIPVTTPPSSVASVSSIGKYG